MIRHSSLYEVELTLPDLELGALDLLRASFVDAAGRLAGQGVIVCCADVRSTVERGCVGVFQALEADDVRRLLEMANVPFTGARIRRSTTADRLDSTLPSC